MAAIQGIVGIVSLVLGLIAIGLFGEATRFTLTGGPVVYASNQTTFDTVNEIEENPAARPGTGVCTSTSIMALVCEDFLQLVKDRLNERIARKGIVQASIPVKGTGRVVTATDSGMDALIQFGLFGGVSMAYAGLVGMAAAAGKASPGDMGAAFGMALVLNLVAFGLACQISAATNYGPSVAQLEADPTIDLWKTIFTARCYSTDYNNTIVTTENERCAKGAMGESLLAFAILNCLVNIVAVLYSVCGQDTMPSKSSGGGGGEKTVN